MRAVDGLQADAHSSAVSSVRRFCRCSVPDHIVLTMPALSPTMEKGNIASWKVKIGDKVKAGDVMAEVREKKRKQERRNRG